MSSEKVPGSVILFSLYLFCLHAERRVVTSQHRASKAVHWTLHREGERRRERERGREGERERGRRRRGRRKRRRGTGERREGETFNNKLFLASWWPACPQKKKVPGSVILDAQMPPQPMLNIKNIAQGHPEII